MQNYVLKVGLFVISFVLLSCAPSVNFFSSGVKRAPKAADHYILVLTAQDPPPPKSILLGEINVFDGGSAINCGYEEVMNIAKAWAREVGADAIKIVSIHEPDLISTCYWVKALAIAFDSTTSYEKPTGPPNAHFLSFADAVPCGDFGNITSITSTHTTIYLIPFQIRTVYEDGKIENVDYPATKKNIRKYIDSLLEVGGRKVLDANKKGATADSLVNFYSSVVKHATDGKGSPLEWGATIAQGIIDSASLVYFPLGIERESQEEVTARFYIFIAKSDGRIIFSRCLPYNAGKWSSDLNTFIIETKGNIPLAE